MLRRALVAGASSVVLALGCTGADPDRTCEDGDQVVTGRFADSLHTELVVVDATSGSELDLVRGGREENLVDPSLSPEGDRAVVQHSVGEYESGGPSDLSLRIVDLRSGELTELVPSGALFPTSPDWSPIDDRIVFTGSTGRIGPDGATIASSTSFVVEPGAGPRPLVDRVDNVHDRVPAWSPDGQQVAFIRDDFNALREGRFDDATSVWVVDADGTDARRVGTAASGETLVWHPDGLHVLLGGLWNSLGTAEHPFVLRSIDIATGSVTRLGDPVDAMSWSPDGRRLYINQRRSTGDGPALSVASITPDGLSVVAVVPTLDGDVRWFGDLDATSCQ